MLDGDDDNDADLCRIQVMKVIEKNVPEVEFDFQEHLLGGVSWNISLSPLFVPVHHPTSRMSAGLVQYSRRQFLRGSEVEVEADPDFQSASDIDHLVMTSFMFCSRLLFPSN